MQCTQGHKAGSCLGCECRGPRSPPGCLLFTFSSFLGATLREVLPTKCPQRLTSSLQNPLSPLGRLHPGRHAGGSWKQEKLRKGPSGSSLGSATWFLTGNSEQTTVFLSEPQFPLPENGSNDTCQVKGVTEKEQLEEGASGLHPLLCPGCVSLPHHLWVSAALS